MLDRDDLKARKKAWGMMTGWERAVILGARIGAHPEPVEKWINGVGGFAGPLGVPFCDLLIPFTRNGEAVAFLAEAEGGFVGGGFLTLDTMVPILQSCGQFAAENQMDAHMLAGDVHGVKSPGSTWCTLYWKLSWKRKLVLKMEDFHG